MNLRLSNPRGWLALAVLLAVPASAFAQPQDLARARSTAPKPSADLTVELTIPTTSPHPCDIDKFQVSSTMYWVTCKVQNRHDGDKVTRYAYSLRAGGAEMMMNALVAARTSGKRATLEFDTDTKKNLEGCPKKDCRNLLSVTW